MESRSLMSKVFILWHLTWVVAIIILLVGCEDTPIPTTNEAKVLNAQVTLLFEHEGCRVYSARPSGFDTFVYTNCNGSTHWRATRYNAATRVMQTEERSVATRATDCRDAQVEKFDELCANSTTPYEELSGSEAFKQGVKCAVESIKKCEGEK